MDRQQILLAKTLESANIPLCVDTFDDRLILQKATYLLQSAGIHMGFRFRWYLRGPYSPDMTASAFGIVNEGDFAQNELKNWNLDQESASRAAKLKPLLNRESESASAKARRLELLASALFLFKTEQAKPEDPNGTSQILQSNDKHYAPEEVNSAVKELKEYGLLT